MSKREGAPAPEQPSIGAAEQGGLKAEAAEAVSDEVTRRRAISDEGSGE